MMNGIRVRLVKQEIIQREAEANRIKALREKGLLPKSHNLPFYPFE